MKRSSKRPAPPENGAPRSLFAMVMDAASVLQTRLEEALNADGLSMAKMEVLHHLSQAREAIPLRVLSKMQHCAPSNMTTLIDRLESDGLVRRIEDADDRRIVRAELTPLGATRAKIGAKTVARAQDEFTASLPPKERAALAKILGGYRVH